MQDFFIFIFVRVENSDSDSVRQIFLFLGVSILGFHEIHAYFAFWLCLEKA
jgi:phage shock protein PspC (stress-responsive transcriptional regulator)